MGVFKCTVCGDPAAWDSLSISGMFRHKCPGPPAGAPTRCPYCEKPDSDWHPSDLLAGRRGTGTGTEYHCTPAFYRI